jgi:hypothetical protein
MPRRALLAVLAFLPLAFALAACGDDRLSAQDLRTRASTICADAANATDRIPVPSEPSQGVRFLRAGLAGMRPAVARLHTLKPPKKLDDSYTKAVALGRLEAALIARNAHAIDDGADVIATFRTLQAQMLPLTREENAFWRALAIPACVRR